MRQRQARSSHAHGMLVSPAGLLTHLLQSRQAGILQQSPKLMAHQACCIPGCQLPDTIHLHKIHVKEKKKQSQHMPWCSFGPQAFWANFQQLPDLKGP